MSRQCSKCSSAIYPKSITGLCRPCHLARMNSDPEVQARRVASLKRVCGQPETRKRLSEALKQVFADPEVRERRRQFGKANYPRTLGSPQGLAASQAKEARAKAGNSISRAKIARAGIPYEHREDYLRLLRSHGLSSKEAAARIRAKIAKDKADRLASMTLFERQMEALNNGAGLIEKPILRRADYQFTLGGVSEI